MFSLVLADPLAPHRHARRERGAFWSSRAQSQLAFELADFVRITSRSRPPSFRLAYERSTTSAMREALRIARGTYAPRDIARAYDARP